MPVCQCFLWWSHAFGAVHVWTGVLHCTRLDGALLRQTRDRLDMYISSLFIHYSLVLLCGADVCVVYLGTGTLLSQLDWFHAAGFAVFTGASLLQHQSMVLLARLRTGRSGKL